MFICTKKYTEGNYSKLMSLRSNFVRQNNEFRNFLGSTDCLFKNRVQNLDIYLDFFLARPNHLYVCENYGLNFFSLLKLTAPFIQFH